MEGYKRKLLNKSVTGHSCLKSVVLVFYIIKGAIAMPIILSQRIDTRSDYQDVPFRIYHYPKIYRNQIKTGDIFVYYQGDRNKRQNRYYFGSGVVGNIQSMNDGEEYYAEIIEGTPFSNTVPIYRPNGGFYESIDFGEVRNKENPPWQNSIRKISDAAFAEILNAANAAKVLDEYAPIHDIEMLDNNQSPLDTIQTLNRKYQNYAPMKRDKVVSAHLDRGKTVTEALKKLLGAKCQICNWIGFEKRDGDRYIEAHHLKQLALSQVDSLCSDNIILVCPNCHREIHNGSKVVELNDSNGRIHIKLGEREAVIPKNSISYLQSIVVRRSS